MDLATPAKYSRTIFVPSGPEVERLMSDILTSAVTIASVFFLVAFLALTTALMFRSET